MTLLKISVIEIINLLTLMLLKLFDLDFESQAQVVLDANGS